MSTLRQVDEGDIAVDIRANRDFQVFSIQRAVCLDQHIAINVCNGIIRLAESLDGDAFKPVVFLTVA